MPHICIPMREKLMREEGCKMCSTASLGRRVTLTIHDGDSLLKDSTASLLPSYTGSKIS